MAIENATNMLRESNPSGLDKELLLPSLRAKVENEERQPTGSDSKKIFTTLNEIGDMLQVHNDDIITELQTANELLSSINKKTGAGVVYGKSGILGNNMITRGIGQIGRFATAPFRGAAAFGRGAANTIGSIAAAPYNLAAGAASTAKNLIGAPFRGIGAMTKNMFTNKDQKKLVELAIEDLDIQKQMLNVQEDTLDEVKAFHKTYKDEQRRMRRGNLDRLEQRRDKRSGAGLLGATAAGASANQGEKNSGSFLKNILGRIAGILGLTAAGAGAGAYGTKKIVDMVKSKPVDGGDKDAGSKDTGDKKDGGRDKSKIKDFFKGKGGPLAIIGGLITAFEIAQAVTDENMTTDEKIIEGTKAGGGSIGGLITGAITGFGTGAALGAAGFNPFTVGIGGLIGAFTGGYAGFKGGEAIGENIGESIVENRNKPLVEKTFGSRDQAQDAIDQTEFPEMYEIVSAPRKPGQRGPGRFKVAVKNYDDSIQRMGRGIGVTTSEPILNYDDSIQRMGRGIGVTTSEPILSNDPPIVDTNVPNLPVVDTSPLSPINITPNDVLPTIRDVTPLKLNPRIGMDAPVVDQSIPRNPNFKPEEVAKNLTVEESTALYEKLKADKRYEDAKALLDYDMRIDVSSDEMNKLQALIDPSKLVLKGTKIEGEKTISSTLIANAGAGSSVENYGLFETAAGVRSSSLNLNTINDMTSTDALKIIEERNLLDEFKSFVSGTKKFVDGSYVGQMDSSGRLIITPHTSSDLTQYNTDTQNIGLRGDTTTLKEAQDLIQKMEQSSLSQEMMSTQSENNQLASAANAVNMAVNAPSNSNTQNINNSNTTVLSGGSTSTVDNYSRVVPL